MIGFASRALLRVSFVAVLSVFVLADQGKPALAGAALVPTRFDDPAPNGCQPSDCSLREAVIAANSSPGEDTIALAAGTYTLSVSGMDEAYAATGDLDVNSSMAVVGQGAADTIIDGGGVDRVMQVYYTGELSISGVTIRGGAVGQDWGGGIWSIGHLTVRNSVIRENSADAGAGVSSGGALIMDGSTVTQNTSSGGGGGLMLDGEGSDATIKNSTISGNTAVNYSGGVHVQSKAHATITNVTISGNAAPSALALSSDADVTLNSVTIAANDSPEANTAVESYEATLRMRNTIIQSVHQGCAGDGTFQSQGHNLSSDGSCNLIAAGDLPLTDAMLDPLADNGGPTETHALLAGSPAINAGDDAACPFTDQRGFGRVDVCDIGAFEFGGTAVTAKQGDVNCDDEVTAVDALFMLRFVAGIPPAAECLNLAGDVNCDGANTAVDALGVLRFVAGLPVNQNEPCADIGTPV